MGGYLGLGWKLLGNYSTLPCNSPNYGDFGWRGGFVKTSFVDITDAEFFLASEVITVLYPADFSA